MAQLNEWLSISKTSGTGNAEITLAASSYEELTQRTESLVVKGQSENKKVYVNVIQNALVPSATLDNYEIIDNIGGVYVNGITSNVPWTAVVNGDWITIDKTQGESGYTPLSITVDAPTETRSGSIIFNAEGVVLALQIHQIYDLKKWYFWVEFESTGAQLSGLTNSIVDFSYSFDGETWETAPPTLSMGENKKVYLQNSTKILRTDSVTTTLKFSTYAKIGGNMASIVDMAEYCCRDVFKENKLLTDASELILPWTTLTDYCYERMFFFCSSLRTAPKLPATTLADWCYYCMFQGCASLVTAPELPATTLAKRCYSVMFDSCTSLVNAPALPATTLTDYCYESMFYRCSSLRTAPKLPATTLAESCYKDMFCGCTYLSTAPELPATTLAESCYSGMFHNCTYLRTAPELPATTLAKSCYYWMFDGCENLTTAPELPATTLVDYCYNNMFFFCKKLTYIKMLATDISAYSCLYEWVRYVPTKGTFIKHPYAELPSGVSGIPSGWTVETATV